MEYSAGIWGTLASQEESCVWKYKGCYMRNAQIRLCKQKHFISDSWNLGSLRSKQIESPVLTWLLLTLSSPSESSLIPPLHCKIITYSWGLHHYNLTIQISMGGIIKQKCTVFKMHSIPSYQVPQSCQLPF